MEYEDYGIQKKYDYNNAGCFSHKHCKRQRK